MQKNNLKGRIEVIVGPMFAGKSTELLRKVDRFKYANRKILVLKHGYDNRFSENNIVSRFGISLSSKPCFSTEDCRKKFNEDNYDTLVIDEVQFFNLDLVDFLVELADNGVLVIAAGLDNDHTRSPWPIMTKLLSVSEFVQKLKAVCIVCGRDASFTFRKKKVKKKLMIGDAESYEARCRSCWREKEKIID